MILLRRVSPGRVIEVNDTSKMVTHRCLAVNYTEITTTTFQTRSILRLQKPKHHERCKIKRPDKKRPMANQRPF